MKMILTCRRRVVFLSLSSTLLAPAPVTQAGTALTSLVAPVPDSPGSHPAALEVVASPAGPIAAVWLDMFHEQEWCLSLNQQVYVSVSRNDGRTWSERAPVGLGFSPHVAWGGGDVLDVVFLRYVAPHTAAAYHRRSLDAGRTWGDAHDVPADPDLDHDYQSPGAFSVTPWRVATSPAGAVAIAWRTQDVAGRMTVSHDGGEHFDPPSEPHRHRPLLPEGLRADQQPLGAARAGEIVFGERRPLVGRIGLGADDGEAAGETELAQRDRRLGAAMAGADDQHVIGGRFDHSPLYRARRRKTKGRCGSSIPSCGRGPTARRTARNRSPPPLPWPGAGWK